MNSLDLALNEYIAIRRALGFELREVAGCLRNFVAFLKIEGASYITRELALRWAIQPAEAQPSAWAWAFGYGPAFRRVAQCEGTANRDPASRSSSSSVSTKDTSHL
jgi:integrase/recombinase XerD